MRFQVGFFSKWWEFARPRPGGLKLIDTNDWNTTTRWGGYNGTKDLRVHSVNYPSYSVMVMWVGSGGICLCPLFNYLISFPVGHLDPRYILIFNL